jgi:putative flippase GtrA
MANIQTWGFYQLEDVYNQLITDVDTNVVDTAVRQSAAQHNRDLIAMLETLTTRTTAREGSFELPSSGEPQPASENGTPRPTQGYRRISQGYPFWRGMDSFGWNQEAYAKKTIEDMDKEMLRMQSKFAAWNMRRMLAAFFTNASWTFSEEGRTDVTVRGLATTSDGSIYLDKNGNLATFEHYTGQAGTISNSANPYTANAAILRGHAANTGVIVHYIGEELVEDTMALANFYAYNPNGGLVNYGDGVDLAAESVARYIGFGNEVIGVVGRGVIVSSARMPANYVLSTVEGFDKLLVMREEPQISLQGLRVTPFQVDSNFRKWDFYEKVGYAVNNPIGAAVREIGDATYDIPTGYDARTLA